MTGLKKSSPRHRRQRSVWRKRLIGVLIIVFSCSLVWGAVLLLNFLGPKKFSVRSSENLSASQESVDLDDEKYGEMSAEELKAFSVGLEQEARLLMDEGKYESASMKYRQSFQLQEIVNRDYSQSLQSNLGRAIRLKLEAKNAAAEPLLVESLRLERQADTAMKADDTDGAVESLQQAIKLQEQLNHEYRDARQVSPSRLRQLEDKLDELKSGEMYARVEGIFARAMALEKSEAWESAGEHFEEAARLQEQLNAEFPNSSHASSSRVDALRLKGQVAKSAILAKEIERESIRLDQLLAARSCSEAIQLLEKLKQSLEGFERSVPLSSLIDETLKLKIDYLYRKKDDLVIIQDQVYRSLTSIPGMENVQMFRTEVPQSLYVLLMGSNPSRNPADSNPVDSVSWIDAVAFCERLSWILGKSVRLPTEEEFRNALGDFDSTEIDSLAWSISESNGFSQPVGQKKPFSNGFFDLLGNVGEWLASEETAEPDTVYQIGGHAQDSSETIASVPMNKFRRSERSRMTGFRFVVLQ